MIFFSLSDRSSKWKTIRDEHIKKQPFCQGCGRKDSLHVHHIEPFHVSPDKELDPNNLITLCSKHCHFVFGHLMDYTSWNPNVKEDCEVYYNKVLNKPIKLETQNDQNIFNSFITNYIQRFLFRRNN